VKLIKEINVSVIFDDKKIDKEDVLSYLFDIISDNKHPCVEFKIKGLEGIEIFVDFLKCKDIELSLNEIINIKNTLYKTKKEKFEIITDFIDILIEERKKKRKNKNILVHPTSETQD